jgi:hypothetical protein
MSNLTNNRLNVTMTAAQVTAVKTALQTIATNMPFLIGLTTEERIAIPKINVNNKAFTEDAINAVVNNGGILPSYISAAGMQSDYQLFTQLDELLGLMRQLVEKAEDTQMLAGSEAFVAALSSYKLFGAAADAGLVGADAIVDSLRQRFISSGTPGAQPAS